MSSVPKKADKLDLFSPTWTGEELPCGQAHNGVNFHFEIKFGQGK